LPSRWRGLRAICRTLVKQRTLPPLRPRRPRGIRHRRLRLSLGARGALPATREGARAIAPVKVQADDTNAAGDAFIGSFARYLAGGLSVDAALTEATRYSALSVARHGAQKSYPTEAEFAAFSAKSG
jgi:ribokinase